MDMKNFLEVLLALIFINSSIFAATYNVVTEMEFNNAIATSAASIESNTINVNVPGGATIASN
jgi:hypothetical protein